MVTDVTSLTGNGLKDWLIQRISSVYFAFYSLFLLGYLLLNPGLTYLQWQGLFAHLGFQIASILALIAVSLHTWVGIWTVTTDYMKCTCLRVTVQMLVVLWLLSQLVWGFMIVWGR